MPASGNSLGSTSLSQQDVCWARRLSALGKGDFSGVWREIWKHNSCGALSHLKFSCNFFGVPVEEWLLWRKCGIPINLQQVQHIGRKVNRMCIPDGKFGTADTLSFGLCVLWVFARVPEDAVPGSAFFPGFSWEKRSWEPHPWSRTVNIYSSI